MIGAGLELGPLAVRRARLSSDAPAAALDLNFLYGVMDGAVTLTRASAATYFDSAGILRTAAVNAPRFDYDPATLAPRGLLIEEARTNLLINSADLASQSVTVAAAVHTLSFYGTGAVTLTGASTAGPLAGTGDGNRVSLTFTPTAGNLTVTVSGSVEWANLEAGAFATSCIPTTTAAVTRAADAAVAAGGAWLDATEGTLLVEFQRASVPAASTWPGFGLTGAAGSSANCAAFFVDGSNNFYSLVKAGNVNRYAPLMGAPAVGAVHRAAVAYKAGNHGAALDGTLAAAGADALALPTLTQLRLSGLDTQYTGHIRRVRYWRTRLAASILQGVTR